MFSMPDNTPLDTWRREKRESLLQNRLHRFIDYVNLSSEMIDGRLAVAYSITFEFLVLQYLNETPVKIILLLE